MLPGGPSGVSSVVAPSDRDQRGPGGEQLEIDATHDAGAVAVRRTGEGAADHAAAANEAPSRRSLRARSCPVPDHRGPGVRVRRAVREGGRWAIGARCGRSAPGTPSSRPAPAGGGEPRDPVGCQAQLLVLLLADPTGAVVHGDATRSRSVRLAPPACHRLPFHTRTSPGSMIAGSVGWSPPQVGFPHRWLSCTTRVAPLSAVNAVSAHIVLHTTGGWVGSGMSWSSAWSGWSVSPGSMRIDDRLDSRQPGREPPRPRRGRRMDRDGLPRRTVTQQVVRPPGPGAFEVVVGGNDPVLGLDPAQVVEEFGDRPESSTPRMRVNPCRSIPRCAPPRRSPSRCLSIRSVPCPIGPHPRWPAAVGGCCPDVRRNRPPGAPHYDDVHHHGSEAEMTTTFANLGIAADICHALQERGITDAFPSRRRRSPTSRRPRRLRKAKTGSARPLAFPGLPP